MMKIELEQNQASYNIEKNESEIKNCSVRRIHTFTDKIAICGRFCNERVQSI